MYYDASLHSAQFQPVQVLELIATLLFAVPISNESENLQYYIMYRLHHLGAIEQPHTVFFLFVDLQGQQASLVQTTSFFYLAVPLPRLAYTPQRKLPFQIL